MTETEALVVGADRRLRWRGRDYPCALGRGGIRFDKEEGDGATPAGSFALRRLLYRADRLAPPVTGLPARALTETDGWCDDPADRNYNRLVRLPHGGRCERLWRDDGRYDLIVVIGHNDDPVRPGAGSAIFIHVAAPGLPPTAGCVALARDDLIEIVSACGPKTMIRIG